VRTVVIVADFRAAIEMTYRYMWRSQWRSRTPGGRGPSEISPWCS